MNYYERHLGDYARDAAHLSMLEHGAYTLLLDRYYTTGEPIPHDQVYRLCRSRTDDERAAVDAVLVEFFELIDGAWVNRRCEQEIQKYQEKQEKARASANARWSNPPKKSDRNANAMRTHSGGNAHQSPDTSNQEEAKAKATVQPAAAPSRFPEFWLVYPNKKAKQVAEQRWKRDKLDGIAGLIIQHVRMMCAQDDGWQRGYAPMGSTYLNQARWTDEPQTAPMARGSPQLAHGGPQSKQGMAIQALMGMKSNANVDQRRNYGRPEQAALLGPGSNPGGGTDPRHGDGVE